MMFLRDRQKGEVNFFIRELWKSYCNFIYLLWLAVGKSSFLQNIVEEIKPGCRNQQRSQIMVNLSFLGGMILKIQSGGWV